MQITVTVNDTATEALNRLGEGLGSRETLHSVMGMGVEAGIRNHLKSEGYVGRVNKLGGQSTGFWKGVSNSVASVADDDAATVSISARGAALQYFGGVVTPKKAKALAVPVHKSAHGIFARQFPERLAYIPASTQFGPFRAGQGQDTVGYLVRGETYTRTRGKNKGNEGVRPIPKDRGGELIYVLRSRTNHEADPKMLPDESAMRQSAAEAAEDYLDSLT